MNHDRKNHLYWGVLSYHQCSPSKNQRIHGLAIQGESVATNENEKIEKKKITPNS